MYGVHLVTVMTPILYETAMATMDPTHKLRMFAIYAPWALIPLALTIKMAFCEKPFGTESSSKKNNNNNKKKKNK